MTSREDTARRAKEKPEWTDATQKAWEAWWTGNDLWDADLEDAFYAGWLARAPRESLSVEKEDE